MICYERWTQSLDDVVVGQRGSVDGGERRRICVSFEGQHLVDALDVRSPHRGRATGHAQWTRGHTHRPGQICEQEGFERVQVPVGCGRASELVDDVVAGFGVMVRGQCLPSSKAFDDRNMSVVGCCILMLYNTCKARTSQLRVLPARIRLSASWTRRCRVSSRFALATQRAYSLR